MSAARLPWSVIEAAVGDLVGRPFERGARGPHAFDCWGLVLEVRRRMHLPLPPDYAGADLPRLKVLELFRNARPPGWARCEMRTGAVVIVPGACHAGILLGARVLHTQPHSGAVADTLGAWAALVGALECWEAC